MPNLHTPDFWQQEFTNANEAIAPYLGLEAEQLTPETMYGLVQVVITQVGRLGLIQKALALEQQPKHRGQPPKPTTDRVAIVDHHIEMNRRKLTPEQARALGETLIEAANQIEGAEYEGTIAE